MREGLRPLLVSIGAPNRLALMVDPSTVTAHGWNGDSLAAKRRPVGRRSTRGVDASISVPQSGRLISHEGRTKPLQATNTVRIRRYVGARVSYISGKANQTLDA